MSDRRVRKPTGGQPHTSRQQGARLSFSSERPATGACPHFRRPRRGRVKPICNFVQQTTTKQVHASLTVHTPVTGQCIRVPSLGAEPFVHGSSVSLCHLNFPVERTRHAHAAAHIAQPPRKHMRASASLACIAAQQQARSVQSACLWFLRSR